VLCYLSLVTSLRFFFFCLLQELKLSCFDLEDRETYAR